MELKQGYKKTEVGIIPEDWYVKLLSELSTEIGDGIHSTPKYVRSSEFFFINGNNLIENSIRITESTMCVSQEEYLRLRQRLSERTVLLSINGTIGNLAFFRDEKVVLGKSAAYINVAHTTSKEFVFHSLDSQAITTYFENELTGTTIRNLSLQSIRNTPIPLPPTKDEQTAIAQALSDADELITSLEKLITKKRNIKQGAMQQLLTGKKRLPGFNGKWEAKKLGEIAEIYQPQTISENDFSNDGYLVYGANGIVGKYYKYNHETWQTIITCRGSTCGTVNKTINKCWITGNAMVVNIDNNKEIDKLFLYFLLSKQDYKNCITGSGQPQIVRKPLAEFEIGIPKDKEEQSAIAQVLSDMDAEITALEQKLSKYRMIKQGMMQELLTGKTRLI